jgi:hypothetical protein
LSAASFASDTAAKTGKVERSLQRDARRGEKIGPDVLRTFEITTIREAAVLGRQDWTLCGFLGSVA